MSVISGIAGADATRSGSNAAANATTKAAAVSAEVQREAIASAERLAAQSRQDAIDFENRTRGYYLSDEDKKRKLYLEDTAKQRETFLADLKRNSDELAPYQAIGTAAIPKYNEMIAKGYTPEGMNSKSAQYMLETGKKALNRALAARGLSGSGNAAERMRALELEVAAKDEATNYNRYQDRFNQIIQALNIGRESSGKNAVQNVGIPSSTTFNTPSNALTGINDTLSSAYTSGANNLSTNYTNSAATLANIFQQSGANRASLYGGISGNAMNTAATGMKAYQLYNTPSMGAADAAGMEYLAW